MVRCRAKGMSSRTVACLLDVEHYCVEDRSIQVSWKVSMWGADSAAAEHLSLQGCCWPAVLGEMLVGKPRFCAFDGLITAQQFLSNCAYSTAKVERRSIQQVGFCGGFPPILLVNPPSRPTPFPLPRPPEVIITFASSFPGSLSAKPQLRAHALAVGCSGSSRSFLGSNNSLLRPIILFFLLRDGVCRVTCLSPSISTFTPTSNNHLVRHHLARQNATTWRRVVSLAKTQKKKE